MATADDFEAEVRDHDARVAATGLALWVGSEPTFTDPLSNDPQWLWEALGDAKRARAGALLGALHARWPEARLLRTEGRRYPGEDAPRWSLGLLQRRAGARFGDPDGEPATRPIGDDALPLFAGDVDPASALTTVTPDPAVVEVNAAPSADAAEFLRRSRDIYAAAAEVGLSPRRLQFNGAVSDSGGGGQITLGGPTPADSPFIRHPPLLARLVRYLNHHPALSYLYCHDHVGPGGQSVRADERGEGAFDELQLALALVRAERDATPELVCRSLAPFLADAAGNAHRAEINVEKLWHPQGGPRGCQGLVEFRALRMQHRPERAAAIACLLRAIVARLVRQPFDEPLVDWGRRLHDRFALPWRLGLDLEDVLADLADHGLGLGPAIAAALRADEFRHQATLALPGATLEVRRALEFWPLLGDAASPEQGGPSRWIDGSTSRAELRLRTGGGPGDGWRLRCGDAVLPHDDAVDGPGSVRLWALRYRAFVPSRGLHPTVGAQVPVNLQLESCDGSRRFALALHEWRPDGEAYPGLPADLAEAARRRAERVTLAPLPPASAPAAPGAAARASETLTFDLRWPR